MKPNRRETQLERDFYQMAKLMGIPEPKREVQFAEGRRWRFDFAWPEKRVAVELEGGAFRRDGWHKNVRRYLSDCDKYNQAALSGWKVLRFTRAHLKDWSAVHITKEALGL